MVIRQSGFWCRVAAFLLALVLLVPLLAACGNDNKATTTTNAPGTTQPSATTQPAATTSAPSTTQPAGFSWDGKTVEIGVISAWSGPAAVVGQFTDDAIKVTNAYVQETGILKGAKLVWDKYDTGGSVAQLSAGLKKLDSDGVCVIGGGASPAEFAAAAEDCNEAGIPYFDVASLPLDLTQMPYVVRVASNAGPRMNHIASFIENVIKPKTVYFIVGDDSEMRTQSGILMTALEAAGIQVIGKQYVDLSSRDLTPLITAAQYANPDLLLTQTGNNDLLQAIYAQAGALGGWGIEQMNVDGAGNSTIFALSAAEGTYQFQEWAQGLSYPTAQLLDRLAQEETGHKIISIYIQLWMITAVNAINQAQSTDRDAIAEYMRSGNFEFEGILGPFTMGTNGENDMGGLIGQVQKGQFVPVQE